MLSTNNLKAPRNHVDLNHGDLNMCNQSPKNILLSFHRLMMDMPTSNEELTNSILFRYQTLFARVLMIVVMNSRPNYDKSLGRVDLSPQQGCPDLPWRRNAAVRTIIWSGTWIGVWKRREKISISHRKLPKWSPYNITLYSRKPTKNSHKNSLHD